MEFIIIFNFLNPNEFNRRLMHKKILRIFLALTFFFSAYTKFIGPGFFELTLIDQHIAASREAAAWFTRIIIAVEVAIGFFLLFGIAQRRVYGGVVLMLVAFTVHLSYLWAIGDTENCGCFGELLAMSPAESILKNIVLLAISGYLFWWSVPEPTPWRSLTALSAAALALIFWTLPIKSPEAAQFQSFHSFVGAPRVDLLSGEKVVAVFNLDCEHCQEAAREMAELQRLHPNAFPETYVLYFQEGSTSPSAFETLTQAKYPYHMIDVNTFFDLIGTSPPRLYYLKDGSVAEVIDADFSQRLQALFALAP